MCGSVVVDSLLIVALIVCGCSLVGPCFADRAGCFTFIVFLMSCDC